MRSLKIGLLCGVAAVASNAAPAIAQSNSASAPAGVNSGSPATELNGSAGAQAPAAGVPATSVPATTPAVDASGASEIVVTAQKRSQKINDVGLTIAAIGGQALKERRITTLADLANSVPGLSFTQSGSNTPVYTLRGVGFYETSLAAYPDVSVYLDEAPLSFPTLTQLTAFDLEQVEVLKGPQGTLFGQNATGGAINYISAKPTNQFEAGGTVSYGRFNDVLTDAYVSGPITDTLTGRISGRVERADDWQKSYTTNATTGKTRTYAGRAILAWKPTDKLRVNLNVNGWKNGSDPQAIQYIAYNPQFKLANPLVGYPFSPENPRSADFSKTIGGAYPGDPTETIGTNDRLIQGTLRVDYDVLNGATLTSLTNYVDYKHDQTYDGDGTTLNAFDVPYDKGNIKSFFQELRIASNVHEPFRWIIGGNYGHDHVYENTAINYRQSSVNAGTGITTGGNDNTQTMQNYAFFGNADYDITHKLTVTGGIRYTNSHRKFDGCTYDIPGGGIAQLFGAIADQVRGASGLPPITPIAPGACAVLNNLTAARGSTPVGNYEPGNFVDNLNQSNISYRAGLTWKPTRGVLLYGNVTKGYKAGSYPTVSASGFQQMLPVTQESVLSYEGGVKATLLDGALQANAAGFYYDYKDKQVRSKLIDPVFGILDNLVNVPKSRVTGGEIELTAHPERGITIYANYTYVNATVLKYTGVNAAGVVANFAGTPLPYSPKNQIAVGGSYEWAIGERFRANLGADLSMRSKAEAIVGGGSSATPLAAVADDHGDPYRIDGYTTLDLRAGVKTADGKYSLEIYGKNVTNTYYWTNVVAFYDTIGRYTGRPATYGVTLGVAFK